MKSTIAQKGFTLIELVVVITILGILAAFALPRFASLEGKAREAATRSLEGSLRSGSALAHALWLAAGTSPAAVAMEGRNIAIRFGYPDEDAIHLVLSDFSGFTVNAVGTTPRTFSKTGASNCLVSYTEPAAANGVPTITLTVSGC